MERIGTTSLNKLKSQLIFPSDDGRSCLAPRLKSSERYYHLPLPTTCSPTVDEINAAIPEYLAHIEGRLEGLATQYSLVDEFADEEEWRDLRDYAVRFAFDYGVKPDFFDDEFSTLFYLGAITERWSCQQAYREFFTPTVQKLYEPEPDILKKKKDSLKERWRKATEWVGITLMSYDGSLAGNLEEWTNLKIEYLEEIERTKETPTSIPILPRERLTSHRHAVETVVDYSHEDATDITSAFTQRSHIQLLLARMGVKLPDQLRVLVSPDTLPQFRSRYGEAEGFAYGRTIVLPAEHALRDTSLVRRVTEKHELIHTLLTAPCAAGLGSATIEGMIVELAGFPHAYEAEIPYYQFIHDMMDDSVGIRHTNHSHRLHFGSAEFHENMDQVHEKTRDWYKELIKVFGLRGFTYYHLAETTMQKELDERRFGLPSIAPSIAQAAQLLKQSMIDRKLKKHSLTGIEELSNNEIEEWLDDYWWQVELGMKEPQALSVETIETYMQRLEARVSSVGYVDNPRIHTLLLQGYTELLKRRHPNCDPSFMAVVGTFPTERLSTTFYWLYERAANSLQFDLVDQVDTGEVLPADDVATISVDVRKDPVTLSIVYKELNNMINSERIDYSSFISMLRMQKTYALPTSGLSPFDSYNIQVSKLKRNIVVHLLHIHASAMKGTSSLEGAEEAVRRELENIPLTQIAQILIEPDAVKVDEFIRTGWNQLLDPEAVNPGSSQSLLNQEEVSAGLAAADSFLGQLDSPAQIFTPAFGHKDGRLQQGKDSSGTVNIIVPISESHVECFSFSQSRERMIVRNTLHLTLVYLQEAEAVAERYRNLEESDVDARIDDMSGYFNFPEALYKIIRNRENHNILLLQLSHVAEIDSILEEIESVSSPEEWARYQELMKKYSDYQTEH